MQSMTASKSTVNRSTSATLWLLFLFLGIGLILPSVVSAQANPTGSLSGTVTDPNGAAVPGATVTIRNTGTNETREVTTDNEGRYSAPALPTGTYQVTITAASFSTVVNDNTVVEAAVPRTLDTTLQVGGVGETITVTGQQELVSPETATTFRQITAEEIVQVPTSTRSFTHLLSAEAGVSADLPPVAINGNGNISPSVNGTRTTSTSLYFNGIDATNITSNEGSLTDNISPAPETLSEVKLQTSLYDASTGRSGGGNFQLITRSGTNDFNGSVYYFLQNERFNANDFFFNRDGIERPRARRNEGGFTIGGPAVRDRFFFFGGYQRTQASTGFVPTASSQSTLPAALGLISGARTPENIVAAFRQLNPAFPLTASQISPLAIALLNQTNPATGGLIIPSPRSNARSVGFDQGAALSLPGVASGTLVGGGNPIVRQRNVFPAEFEQDQFTLRLDGRLSANNTLNGTFFFANFPGFDPFTAPSSQTSPFVLRRDDRNRTLAISDTHIFSGSLINEARFGYFSLNNSRQLDDPFLEIESSDFGIINPALEFDSSPGTRRLGQFIGRNNISGFSFGGPNDSFNRREQTTYSFSDSLIYTRGSHTFRFGGEFRHQQYNTNLPEEQATEFEKFDNFTQFLLGRATEADTQFGLTDKQFRFNDFSLFITDDFRVTPQLTLNLGVRYEFFGLPTEQNGRIGNFDPALSTNTENPLSGFIVPNNVQPTGLAAVDQAIAATTRVDNGHTLNGQDRNNFAPRFGFAYSPARFNNRLVIRGGYGIFFDRPSTAFINTIFSNYPFLREIEVTAGAPNIPIQTAFSTQNTALGLNNYLPARIVYEGAGTFRIRDNTPVTTTPGGANNPTDFVTNQPIRGNIAETFEFRAIDRNLRTPYIQQYNLGVQYEVGRNNLIEVRYVGTRGVKLLQAVALNQGFDLNDSATPDYVFARFTNEYQRAFTGAQARVAAGTLTQAQFTAAFPNGALRPGATARERGTGVVFGFNNVLTGNARDLNLTTNSSRNATTGAISGGTILGFEARGPILGFNIPEALLLTNGGTSNYNALQVNFQRRLSQGLQFNTSYTFSKSLDTSSVDPGSTAGGGRPDTPNAGFIVQGNSYDPGANYALSDFDRTHRFSASFVYNIPTFGRTSRFLTGFQLAGFLQAQSGTPFTIFSPEGEAGNVAALEGLRNGSGGLFRLGFGRPNLVTSLEDLRNGGNGVDAPYFNAAALGSPLGGFGNLGRNVLRGPTQRRFDLSLSKTTNITEGVSIELRADAFNLFNNVNFANPSGDISDGTDFGFSTNTIGGPRVIQFGAKLRF